MQCSRADKGHWRSFSIVRPSVLHLDSDPLFSSLRTIRPTVPDFSALAFESAVKLLFYHERLSERIEAADVDEMIGSWNTYLLSRKGANAPSRLYPKSEIALINLMFCTQAYRFMRGTSPSRPS